MPAPGCTTLATIRPTISASVEKIEEIGERLAGDAADLVQVAHAGDAGDHGQEDHRRDDHLDQLDEGVAERLQRLARSSGQKCPSSAPSTIAASTWT